MVVSGWWAWQAVTLLSRIDEICLLICEVDGNGWPIFFPELMTHKEEYDDKYHM